MRHGEVLAVGRAVKLQLQLADGSTLLAGEGTVFWTREADPSRAETGPGMGIRFTRLTADSQRMLSFLLAEKEERERQDDNGGFDEDERTVVATEEEMRAAVGSSQDDVDLPLPPSSASLAASALALVSLPGSPPLRRIGTPPPIPVVAPVLPSLADVIEMAAPAHRPHQSEANRIAADAQSEPHRGSSALAWESASAPFIADYDLEQTDLTPKKPLTRTRAIGIGVGLVVAGAAVVGVCFMLLSTPVAKPLSALTSPGKGKLGIAQGASPRTATPAETQTWATPVAAAAPPHAPPPLTIATPAASAETPPPASAPTP